MNMNTRGTASSRAGGSDISPYDGMISDYVGAVNDMRDERNKWRTVAFFSLILILISFGIVLYAVNLPKTKLHVIEVAPWGEANYLGDISSLSYSGYSIPQAAIEFQIREFVNNIFSLSSDPDVVYMNINKTYNSLTTECGNKLTVYLRENDPFSNINKHKIYIKIESVIRVTDSTYQIDWYETKTTMENYEVSRNRIRGLFTIALLDPEDEEIEESNPLGIYIADFDTEDITE